MKEVVPAAASLQHVKMGQLVLPSVPTVGHAPKTRVIHRALLCLLDTGILNAPKATRVKTLKPGAQRESLAWLLAQDLEHVRVPILLEIG